MRRLFGQKLFISLSVAFLASVTAGIGGGCYQENSEQPECIRLATWNLRCPGDPAPYDWNNRLPRIRKMLKKQSLDIWGTQELVHAQLMDVIADGKYSYVGGGRDDFKEGGEYSCILYNPKRFELLSGGTFALGEQPDKPGIRAWDAACPRIATWGLFRDKNTGKEFIYYNTHLDHVGEQARINSIRQLVDHAKENATGKPLVITGDFNAFPDSTTYATADSLLNDASKISLTEPSGARTTYHGYGKVEREPIDFIFVSDEFNVYSHHVDDSTFDGYYCSDHHPVIAELEIR